MTTMTKVDKFNDSPCMNLTNLHNKLPPSQDTVAVHADSALRQKSDTSKSATASSRISLYMVLLSLWLVRTMFTMTPMFPAIENQAMMPKTTDLLKALVVKVGASSDVCSSLLFTRSVKLLSTWDWLSSELTENSSLVSNKPPRMSLVRTLILIVYSHSIGIRDFRNHRNEISSFEQRKTPENLLIRTNRYD